MGTPSRVLSQSFIEIRITSVEGYYSSIPGITDKKINRERAEERSS
jgi:hypothetical protein